MVLISNIRKICEHLTNATGVLLVEHNRKVGGTKLILCTLPLLFGALPRKAVLVMKKPAFWLPGLEKMTAEISGGLLTYP